MPDAVRPGMVQFNPNILIDVLRGQPAAPNYWVAFSGGLDSTVLLHALAAQRDQLPGPLFAIHVNHGINPDADAWQRHCEAECLTLGVDLTQVRVRVPATPGASLEATARECRYAAFAKNMQPGDCLLLAHHLDDQLETFLLQALRGAGVAGLAAMPAAADFVPGRLVRPMLEVSRESLLNWARAHKLRWIDDSSNQDVRFDRNYLRHEVLPRLKQRWPAAAETVARAARHCAEASDLLAVQAADDLRRFVQPDCRSLALQAVRELSRPRAKQLIRYWLAECGFAPPPAHKLEQVFTDMLSARPDRIPCVEWAGVELRRYRDRLYVQSPMAAVPEPFLLRAGEFHELGQGLGRLGLVVAKAGIQTTACPGTGLRVTFRAGGERCQPAGQAHRRPLKKWLQELDVLPWMRACLPLLEKDGELMAVAGLFICEPFRAQADQPALRLVWENAPAILGDNKKTADFEGGSATAAF